MAHKHNRRRVRPRSRRNKFSNNLPTVYETFDTFDTLPSFSIPSIPFPNLMSFRQSLVHAQTIRSINDKKSWMNPNAVTEAYSHPRCDTGRQSIEEVGTLRKFGGEPGDDPGLCDKMQEMFDGMDWIDV